MCGEIEDWQYAKNVTIRLTTTGAQTLIVLSEKFSEVEEIRLNEFLFIGYNGGVSACSYLRADIANMSHGTINNEANSGLLVPVDVLNPHQIYNNPRVLARGDRVSINQFSLSILLPTGVPVAFTEAALVLTFVCRRSADSIAEIRKLKASVDYLPSIKDTRATNPGDWRN